MKKISERKTFNADGSASILRVTEIRDPDFTPQDRECAALWRALPHRMAGEVADAIGLRIGENIIDGIIRWAHARIQEDTRSVFVDGLYVDATRAGADPAAPSPD